MTSFVLLKSEASTDLFDKCLIFFFSFLLTITRAQGAYPQILSSQWKSTLIVLTDVVVKQCRANNTVQSFSVIFHRINYEVPNPSSYRFLEFYKRYKIQKWPLKSNAILWNLGIQGDYILMVSAPQLTMSTCTVSVSSSCRSASMAESRLWLCPTPFNWLFLASFSIMASYFSLSIIQI